MRRFFARLFGSSDDAPPVTPAPPPPPPPEPALQHKVIDVMASVAIAAIYASHGRDERLLAGVAERVAERVAATIAACSSTTAGSRNQHQFDTNTAVHTSDRHTDNAAAAVFDSAAQFGSGVDVDDDYGVAHYADASHLGDDEMRRKLRRAAGSLSVHDVVGVGDVDAGDADDMRDAAHAPVDAIVRSPAPPAQAGAATAATAPPQTTACTIEHYDIPGGERLAAPTAGSTVDMSQLFFVDGVVDVCAKLSGAKFEGCCGWTMKQTNSRNAGTSRHTVRKRCLGVYECVHCPFRERPAIPRKEGK
jgi:hypothetical protein